MMQLHSWEISKCVEKDCHAIILLDRAGWHMTEQMQMPSNISYKNHKEIEEACCEAWNIFISEEGSVKRPCSRDWAEGGTDQQLLKDEDLSSI